MNYLKLILTAILSFILTVICVPLVIGITKKEKANQPILQYVEQHKSKSGTPTMGGIGFILPAVLTAIVFTNGLSTGKVAAIVTLVYSLLGFLDDFLKIKRKDNGGLTPIQKIIGQTAVALIMGWYCYRNSALSTLRFPFTDFSVDLNYWIIPIVAFVFIALTNGVNLTDGLDCLASTVSSVFFVCFTIIIGYLVIIGRAEEDMLVFTIAILFAVLGFIIYNSSPAKIFMGDTGSLALGGAVATTGAFSGNLFITAIIGITFVISCITVIIQVVVFKIKKKRVFLMAPFHHHLEKKGWSEPSIVALYSAITAVFGIVAIYSVIAFQK